MNDAPAFTIGEVAAMLGISPHTIRAWERRHLVVRPLRTVSGQRRYTADDVELLRQIKHERHVHGLSMRVATMAAQGLVVPDTGEPGTPVRTAPAIDAGTDPLRLAADLVPEVVVVVDGRGRIAHANTPFVRFCDVMPGQLRGAPFADFVDPFDRAKAVLTYQAPLRQRRDWELNLRTPRHRALFSFGCWPVAAPEGPMLVLVGSDLSARSLPAAAQAPAAPAPPSAQPRTRPGVPAPLRPVLEGVADPVRTLWLLRRWLDATPFGVVLASADAELTVVFANRAFSRWIPPDRQPVEGRSWASLHPAGAGDRLATAALETIRSAQPRTVSGPRPTGDGDAGDGTPPVWDIEITPVTEVGGAVTHLLFLVADVTEEAEAARSVHALASCTPAFRQAAGPRQLLAEAARHAQALLPNAGSLVAAAPVREREAVSVVAASGAWARTDQGGEQRLRLTLVRDVIRTCASIEVQRAGGARAIETLLIVPLSPARLPGDGRDALGALAFSRLGPATFSADDRQLIDEFAGRVGLALSRAELLG